MHIKGLEPQNILVRMPNWIGDLVMATPVLHDLRKAFPQAQITAMCIDPIAPLIEKDPNIDALFTFKKGDGKFLRRENRNIVMTLQKGNYDWGILLTNSFSSAWLFWQAKIPFRLGFSTFWRRCLLNVNVRFPAKRDHQHLVATYKHLLKPLGISISSTPPKIYLDEKEIQNAHAFLRDKGYEKGKFLIGINSDAAYGETKRWLTSRFHEVAKTLLENNKDLYVVFFGDSSSLERIKEMVADLPIRAINLAGMTSLRELAGLIQCVDVFLTNDSGPMHIAAALDIPVVALFGSTSEMITGPFVGGVIVKKPLPCSPCFQRKCKKNVLCMQAIKADEVIKIMQNKINEKNT